MGYTNINILNLKMEESNWEDNAGTILHEILHALGYSKWMFKHFLDKNGKKRGEDVIK